MLILADPEEAPTREERDRLKEFISDGGHVIATGMFAGTFLPENDSVPDCSGWNDSGRKRQRCHLPKSRARHQKLFWRRMRAGSRIRRHIRCTVMATRRWS